MNRHRLLCCLMLFVLAAPAWGWAQFFGDQPDLTLENVQLDPVTPKAGQTLTIQVDVVNTQRARIDDRFVVTFAVDGERVANVQVRLGVSQRRTVQASWAASEGDHVLRIEVDAPRNEIEERNERNNVLELGFSVSPDSSIDSFTRTALVAQAVAWEQAGVALNFSTSSSNLLVLLDLVQEAFADFSKAFTVVEAALRALAGNWPAAFAADNLVNALLPHYSALKSAAGQIEAGLDQLDLNATIVAMGDIETSLRALAALARPTLPLGRLSEAADALQRAGAAADEAQKRFDASGAGALAEPVADLIAEVQAFGQTVEAVARLLQGSAQQNTAQFLSASGEPVRELAGQFPVEIRVSGTALAFQLVDEAGASVLSLSSAEGALGWDGRGADGAALRARLYFYRIRWDGPAGEVVDVGSLLLGGA